MTLESVEIRPTFSSEPWKDFSTTHTLRIEATPNPEMDDWRQIFERTYKNRPSQFKKDRQQGSCLLKVFDNEKLIHEKRFEDECPEIKSDDCPPGTTWNGRCCCPDCYCDLAKQARALANRINTLADRLR